MFVFGANGSNDRLLNHIFDLVHFGGMKEHLGLSRVSSHEHVLSMCYVKGLGLGFGVEVRVVGWGWGLGFRGGGGD